MVLYPARTVCHCGSCFIACRKLAMFLYKSCNPSLPSAKSRVRTSSSMMATVPYPFFNASMSACACENDALCQWSAFCVCKHSSILCPCTNDALPCHAFGIMSEHLVHNMYTCSARLAMRVACSENLAKPFGIFSLTCPSAAAAPALGLEYAAGQSSRVAPSFGKALTPGTSGLTPRERTKARRFARRTASA